MTREQRHQWPRGRSAASTVSMRSKIDNVLSKTTSAKHLCKRRRRKLLYSFLVAYFIAIAVFPSYVFLSSCISRQRNQKAVCVVRLPDRSNQLVIMLYLSPQIFFSICVPVSPYGSLYNWQCLLRAKNKRNCIRLFVRSMERRPWTVVVAAVALLAVTRTRMSKAADDQIVAGRESEASCAPPLFRALVFFPSFLVDRCNNANDSKDGASKSAPAATANSRNNISSSQPLSKTPVCFLWVVRFRRARRSAGKHRQPWFPVNPQFVRLQSRLLLRQQSFSLYGAQRQPTEKKR